MEVPDCEVPEPKWSAEPNMVSHAEAICWFTSNASNEMLLESLPQGSRLKQDVGVLRADGTILNVSEYLLIVTEKMLEIEV